MKIKYSLIVLIALFAQCNHKVKSADSIDDVDKPLIDSLGIDIEIIQSIRNYTNSKFYKIITEKSIFNNEIQQYEIFDLNIKGFAFMADEKKAREIVLGLNSKFITKGYLIYISESNFGHKPDEITVIKSEDQFDILMLEETNGINYGIENDSIIKKLKIWDRKNSFQIIGADIDYIEAIFIAPPTGVDSLAKELYEFCPDIVEQGTGTIEKLEEELKATEILYLWWD